MLTYMTCEYFVLRPVEIDDLGVLVILMNNDNDCCFWRSETCLISQTMLGNHIYYILAMLSVLVCDVCVFGLP